jgi:hypothetical protein
MRTTDGFRVTSGPHRATGLNVFGIPAGVWLASEKPTEEDRYDLRDEEIVGVPDLADPATLGCLLALVREAYGDATATPIANCYYDKNHSERRWSWHADEIALVHRVYETSEASALVAALEGAPSESAVESTSLDDRCECGDRREVHDGGRGECGIDECSFQCVEFTLRRTP